MGLFTPPRRSANLGNGVTLHGSSRGFSVSQKVGGVSFNSRDSLLTVLNKMSRMKPDANDADAVDREIQQRQDAEQRARLNQQRANAKDLMVLPSARNASRLGDDVVAYPLPAHLGMFDARYGQHRLNPQFVDVVAEEYYPANMAYINKVFRNLDAMDDVQAVLVPEYVNEHDEYAIMVLVVAGVDCYLVGYLNRAAARVYFPVLDDLYRQGFVARIPVRLEHENVVLVVNAPTALVPMEVWDDAVLFPASNMVAVMGEDDEAFEWIANGGETVEFPAWLQFEGDDVVVMFDTRKLGSLSKASTRRYRDMVAAVIADGAIPMAEVTAERGADGRWEAQVYLP